MKSNDGVEDGMYVLVQRGDQDRIIEFKSNETINYGKGSTQQCVELKNAVGTHDYARFRVTLKEGGGDKAKYELTLLDDSESSSLVTGELTSGKDNRDIFDDNKAQKLNADSIRELKERGASGSEILETLISNSASFTKKTKYSQEKFLKKKEKMYGDAVTFIQPSLSILADYYFKRDPSKILNIRPDTLSQILSYANVHAEGSYLVYESGCSGLVVAAVLSRLRGHGLALHVHPGSTPQRQAVNFLNFRPTELKPLRSLDVFYLARNTGLSQDQKPASIDNGDAQDSASAPKKPKIDDSENVEAKYARAPVAVTRPENERSLATLESTKFSGLIIAGKEHPLTILQRLLPCLAASAPFVVFSQFSEPLGECYMFLKEKNRAVNIHLVENWCRNIQVETERTHPEINMSANGGYFLIGTAVS